MKDFLIWSVFVRVSDEDCFYCLKTECGVDVGIEAIDINCEEVGVVGDDHGPDSVYEVVCIFNVTGVFGREGAEEVVYVLSDVVGGAAAIRNNGSAGGDFMGYCPGGGVFMNLGK